MTFGTLSLNGGRRFAASIVVASQKGQLLPVKLSESGLWKISAPPERGATSRFTRARLRRGVVPRDNWLGKD